MTNSMVRVRQVPVMFPTGIRYVDSHTSQKTGQEIPNDIDGWRFEHDATGTKWKAFPR